MRAIPLSSVAIIPMSGETREALLAAGVAVVDVDSEPRTELWARSLLEIMAGVAEAGAPTCFQREYQPGRLLCDGCAWMPRCWHSCPAYISRMGELGPPTGVPESLIARQLAKVKPKRPPPKGMT